MSTETFSHCTCSRSGGECRFCEGAREHAETHCAEETRIGTTHRTGPCGAPAVAIQEMTVAAEDGVTADPTSEPEWSPICAAHMAENQTYFADPDTDYVVSFEVWAPRG